MKIYIVPNTFVSPAAIYH